MTDYEICNIPYHYDRDLFYANKETYDMMYDDDDYYQPYNIEYEYIRATYIIPILILSKEMIEKGMYYCSNQKAKDWMQEYINKWIEDGKW